MRKLIHLIALVIIFGAINVDSLVYNRKSCVIDSQRTSYKIDGGVSTNFAVKPREINGELLVPITELKEFFEIDEISRNPNDSISIYREQPVLFLDNYSSLKQNSLTNEIVELIDFANKSIDIEMYRFQDSSVIHALSNARRRGIKIRILLDKYIDNTESGKSLCKKCNKSLEHELECIPNCEIKWKKGDKAMHRKVAIFDNETVYLGSANWTDLGFGDTEKGKNWELSIIYKNTKLAESITEELDNIWGKPTENTQWVDSSYEPKKSPQSSPQ